MSANNKKSAPRDPKQIADLRGVFDPQVVCNWIRFHRVKNISIPMPGEDGYSFSAHITALRTAIALEGENRMHDAAPYRSGADDLAEMYAATLRIICAMDPEIAEACRPLQKRRPRMRSGGGPSLVYSRD